MMTENELRGRGVHPERNEFNSAPMPIHLTVTYDIEVVTRLVTEAIKNEREICAKICDSWHEQGRPFAAKYAAEDIRNRI